MKIPSLLLLVPCSLVLSASAQTVQWAHAVGGTSVEHIHAVAVDATGAVISVGVYQTTVDLDPGAGVFNVSSNSSSADVFVRKLDANGTFLWGGSIGGNSTEEGWSVAVDAQDNVFITGRALGPLDLDPTAGVFTATTLNGGFDAFVVKLSSTGAFLWGQTIGGANTDVGYDVATDAAGDVYLSGSIGAAADMDPGPGTSIVGGNGQNDAFVMKIDPNGLFVWARSIGGSTHDEGWSLAVTAAGAVYFAGEFRGTADLDPGPGTQNATSAGNADIFVQKLDANGAFLWAARFGGTSVERARSIAVDASGACVFTGQINSVTDMDPGPGTFDLPGSATEDAYLTKLTSSGQLAWAFLLKSFLNEGLCVSVDANGNIYTAGTFGSTLDIDPGPGVNNLVASATDGYLIRYSPAGALDWGFAVTGTGFQVVRAIAADANWGVAAGGTFINTMDVEPGPGTTNLIATNFNGDAWLACYAQASPCANIAVQLKALLGGPWKTANQLMTDSLRANGLLPLTEPYSAMGFLVSGPPITNAGVLATAGSDAAVDWVLVELRDPLDPVQVVERRVGLVQRDGDVMAPDGSSAITFCANAGNYLVALRHRNHLGIMTGGHSPLTSSPTFFDLTLPASPVFGIDPRQDVNGVMMLWPGNVAPNTLVSYAGAGNDRDPILVRIGGGMPTATTTGYWPEDVNMDGIVKYAGANNDRDPILVVIGGITPTNTRPEQLP